MHALVQFSCPAPHAFLLLFYNFTSFTTGGVGVRNESSYSSPALLLLYCMLYYCCLLLLLLYYR